MTIGELKRVIENFDDSININIVTNEGMKNIIVIETLHVNRLYPAWTPESSVKKEGGTTILLYAEMNRMSTKIKKGKPLWNPECPSGAELLYGKELSKDVIETYKTDDLNEYIIKKGSEDYYIKLV